MYLRSEWPEAKARTSLPVGVVGFGHVCHSINYKQEHSVATYADELAARCNGIPSKVLNNRMFGQL